MPRFADLGPSTVRKRIGELRDKGWVIDSGKKIDRATVWRALSDAEVAAENSSEVQRKLF